MSVIMKTFFALAACAVANVVKTKTAVKHLIWVA
jgi:hypothetical protein